MDSEVYKARLQALKSELQQASASSADSQKPVQLDQQSVGRLSRMDAMQGQQMAQATERRRAQQLLQIEAALRRIAEDDYGYCIDCGEAINEKRLAIEPTTLRCIECLQLLEKS
ncbi:molecular chaperone DnaK [Aliidiomarina minuta]|uniref:Molecular chaperone DnaK n=1 Tax=Aliidiomarina minuta TaxID=880057 RepID=A0A432WA64_9GAMM|nr:TraR/DksA family transcriptional regulator [Aliidiomarina minuta]RUO26992.1 molecular chaperone DnaK [Aliidiomarina minuta]